MRRGYPKYSLVLMHGVWDKSHHDLFRQVADDTDYSRPRLIRDDTHAPSVFVFRDEIHNWLRERQIRYEMRYRFTNIRTPDTVTAWLLMDKDERVMFKLTWGGQ